MKIANNSNSTFKVTLSANGLTRVVNLNPTQRITSLKMFQCQNTVCDQEAIAPSALNNEERIKWGSIDVLENEQDQNLYFHLQVEHNGQVIADDVIQRNTYVGLLKAKENEPPKVSISFDKEDSPEALVANDQMLIKVANCFKKFEEEIKKYGHLGGSADKFLNLVNKETKQAFKYFHSQYKPELNMRSEQIWDAFKTLTGRDPSLVLDRNFI